MRDDTLILNRNPGNNVRPGDPYSAKSRNIGHAQVLRYRNSGEGNSNFGAGGNARTQWPGAKAGSRDARHDGSPFPN
ncbi:MAG: hypothetical protein IID00_05670 [Chloroflexi bacterium]|nr:hypothetical protein [Chloroflexota bacterium]